MSFLTGPTPSAPPPPPPPPTPPTRADTTNSAAAARRAAAAAEGTGMGGTELTGPSGASPPTTAKTKLTGD